ncbi:hypothetical protein VTN77DRAFT_1058 [Rasamsonia byssochlamydoides]|uniref:uncharacterized protein n=1 Tax=Rasamsonia byssochlamydoides TaxID=89139 RepID=UPI0037425534
MASSLPLRRLPVGIARKQVKIGPARRFQSTSAPQTQNPVYPLYPSVQQLLHEKGIPDSEISKIPATGPKGRLLKGDVLAYLGAIAADYPSTQAARIAKLSHLDLSNIKLAAAPAKPAEPALAAEEAAAPAPPAETSVAVSISLASVLSVQKKIKETLGVTIPLSTFIARAADIANDDLPRSPLSKPTADELFDEILGASPVQTSRGDYIPEINAVPLSEVESSASVKKPVKEDIIDFLAGKAPKRAATSPVASKPAPSSDSTVNVFSLTVPVGEERRAKAFLDRIKTVLTVEPGRLVL